MKIDRIAMAVQSTLMLDQRANAAPIGKAPAEKPPGIGDMLLADGPHIAPSTVDMQALARRPGAYYAR